MNYKIGDTVTVKYDRITDTGLGWMWDKNGPPKEGVIRNVQDNPRYGDIVQVEFDQLGPWWTYRKWCQPESGPW